jgi:hypothetical protein
MTIEVVGGRWKDWQQGCHRSGGRAVGLAGWAGHQRTVLSEEDVCNTPVLL